MRTLCYYCIEGGFDMPVTNINIRVDSEIKTKAQELFASMGMDMTTAINVFLRKTILQKGIPFNVTTEPEKPMPIPGCLKGKIWMADDFNAPLEDFKEYME